MTKRNLALLKRRTEEAGGPAARRKAIRTALGEIERDLESQLRIRMKCVSDFDENVWRAGKANVHGVLNYPYHIMKHVDWGTQLRQIALICTALALAGLTTVLYRNEVPAYQIVGYDLIALGAGWWLAGLLNPKGLPDSARFYSRVSPAFLGLVLLGVAATVYALESEMRGALSAPLTERILITATVIAAIAALSTYALVRSLLWSKRLTKRYHALGNEQSATEALQRSLTSELNRLARLSAASKG